MKTVHVPDRIESRVGEVKFGYWNGHREEFIEVTEQIDSLSAMARYLGISGEAVDTMQMLFNNLRDAMEADLIDVWKEVERIEEDLDMEDA